MTEQEWIKELEDKGFIDVQAVDISAGENSEEHTHDVHTIHVILKGELTIVDQTGKKIYKPGDVVEFPEGTTHVAYGNVRMLVGFKPSN